MMVIFRQCSSDNRIIMNSQKVFSHWTVVHSVWAILPLMILASTIYLFGMVGWIIWGLMVSIFTSIFLIYLGKTFKFVLFAIYMFVAPIGYIFGWRPTSMIGIGALLIFTTDVLSTMTFNSRKKL